MTFAYGQLNIYANPKPWHVPDEDLLQLLPFVELFGGVFDYLKDAETFPVSAFQKASFLVKKPRDELVNSEMCRNLVTFTRGKVIPQRDLLFPYYIAAAGEECKWYEPMQPKSIIEACPVP
jgi:hypothetical protein